jgi:hypothetical protein
MGLRKPGHKQGDWGWFDGARAASHPEIGTPWQV